MSLIHDALKSMDAPQQDPKLVLARAPVAVARRRPAWLDAALAFFIVLGAGVVGWLVWQSQMKPKRDLTPVAVAPVSAAPQPVAAPMPIASPPPADALQPAVAMPAVTTPVVADVGGAAPVAPPAAPQVAVATNVVLQSPSPASTSLPAAPKVSAPSLVAANAQAGSAPTMQEAPRLASQRQARSSRPAPAPVEPMPVAAPAVDDTPVELRFARFVAAMKEGRGADAERELAALKERLPAGSLGLLRAQAWFDLRAGRDAAAADGYRAILERMLGDEEAAINLASIQARQQKPEEARATLDAALRLRPDSAALRAALGQFTPAAR